MSTKNPKGCFLYPRTDSLEYVCPEVDSIKHLFRALLVMYVRQVSLLYATFLRSRCRFLAFLFEHVREQYLDFSLAVDSQLSHEQTGRGRAGRTEQS